MRVIAWRRLREHSPPQLTARGRRVALEQPQVAFGDQPAGRRAGLRASPISICQTMLDLLEPAPNESKISQQYVK
jgi:hypothetical protein